MLRALPTLLLVLTLLASPAMAGEASPQPRKIPIDRRIEQEVRDMVRATGGIKSSWGAYYAGKYCLPDLVPDLLALVARENDRPENGTPLIRKAALDSLVRLDAEVPAALLMARPDEICLPEALILLARDPEANRDALVQMMDTAPVKGEHRWAAAVLLTPIAPPGLARRLLAEVRLRLCVTARDPGSNQLSLSLSGGGAGIWGGTGRIFPPRPTYSFHLEASRGDLAIGFGALPLFYRRTEASRSGRTEPKTRGPRRSKIALRCIGELIDRDLGAEPDVRTVGIDWVDEAKFKAAVDAERSRLIAYWMSLVQELTGRGLLLPDEHVPVLPSLEVHVHDARKQKEPPLPDVSSPPSKARNQRRPG